MAYRRQYMLPDMTKIVPFPWSTNPHYPKASADSSAWIDSFGLLKGDDLVKFKKCQLELLGSYMFSYAGCEELRTCCDYINMFTAVDDFSDHQDGDGAQESADAFLAGVSGKPHKQTPIYRMASQFRERMARKASPRVLRRFVDYCTKYCDALPKEAQLRERGYTLDIASFMELRRDFGGFQPCVGLYEYVHGIDLPDEVFENEYFKRVYWAGVDMLCLTNDLYSFNREQAKGIADNSFFTVVMKERGYDYQEAADFIGEEHRRLVAQLLDGFQNIPSFGEDVDDEVRKYVYSTEQGVIGNIIWCLETSRYFGTKVPPLQRNRLVKLWDVNLG